MLVIGSKYARCEVIAAPTYQWHPPVNQPGRLVSKNFKAPLPCDRDNLRTPPTRVVLAVHHALPERREQPEVTQHCGILVVNNDLLVVVRVVERNHVRSVRVFSLGSHSDFCSKPQDSLAMASKHIRYYCLELNGYPHILCALIEAAVFPAEAYSSTN